MNKYFLSILLLLFSGVLTAQNKSSILHVIKSDSLHSVTLNSISVSKVYRGVFQQGTTILSSDSAYLHQKENYVDAFGHVIITQGDTLHIFGDKLNYQGNTKIAIMTDNVRMIDKDAILTTNYLTYNTATKYGTYTGGGKLVNKDNTLTSKNGYYLASSRDAYFRYNVVLVTTDATIKTDTLRYNSGTRISYFYGPTNILGKKDNDTLYTENGTYNTQTEQAFFGKKNQYRQGTKTLKGDSLFYDRLIGYGKAVKHVTFTDTEQKVIMHGELGENFKKGNRTLVTQHAYVVFVTEEKDTTKRSKADSLKTDSLKSIKNVLGKTKLLLLPKNGMPALDAATAKQGATQVQAALKNLPDSTRKSIEAQAKKQLTTMPRTLSKKDSAQVKAAISTAKTVIGNMPKAKQDSLIAKVKKGKFTMPGSIPNGDMAKLLSTGIPQKSSAKNVPIVKKDTLPKRDTSHIKRDSIFMTADTIETEIITYKELRTTRQNRLIAGIRDTSIKIIPSIVYTKPVKYIEPAFARVRGDDTTAFHKNYFRKKPVVRDTSQRKSSPVAVATNAPKRLVKPVVKRYVPIDSVNLSQEVKLNDTARVRILVAAHHAKIFKSDLQAKADSIFFSYSDSVARMYYKPMIWAQNSQLSADTINLQMKKKQLDNLEMYPSAFVVNIEKNDSTHFNQVGGKKMRGFFKNGKMDKMFVFANAETIYFDRDSGKVTQMHRTISSKIRVRFKANEPLDLFWYLKPEAKITPIDKLKEEDKILRNFVWKPEERPVSKESIINPEKFKPPVKKGKPDGKKTTGKGDAKTDLKTGVKMSTDSVKLKTDILQPIKAKSDTLQHMKTKTDTSKIKKNEPVKQ